MAYTETSSYQDTLNSQYLTNSISSLSRSKTSSSIVVRTYKQATQLYLTKRFKEALDALEPIITPQNGAVSDSIDHVLRRPSQQSLQGLAPIARSSRGTRTKVWVFYLSLIHAIIELGAEQGKLIFGSNRWRELAAKAREGTIWEEVVRNGYEGNEGEVDAEVVVNLSTLLLGHMQNQQLNQRRLETYLSTSATVDASLGYAQDGISTPMSDRTSSPKELTSRLKVLELYTLHILPANNEWEYAESFIEMNDILDEERKEAFLQALQGLKDEKESIVQREKELEELREREIEEQKAAAEAKRKAEEQREQERRKAAEAAAARPASTAGSTSSRADANGSHPPSGKSPAKPQSKPSRQPAKKAPPPPAGLYGQATAVLGNFQDMVLQAGRNMNMDNVMVIRVFLFFLAFLLLFARRNMRERLKRALGDSWVKVKQTIGMGTKVSYI